tara:strand:+ start:1247 stop:1426 length:180 start_codon:yes stop_codon:yes gene_type:complete
MLNVWLLIWFSVVPDQGVKYHHLGNFDNETLCKAELRVAAVMATGETEMIECIGVKTDD